MSTAALRYEERLANLRDLFIKAFSLPDGPLSGGSEYLPEDSRQPPFTAQ